MEIYCGGVLYIKKAEYANSIPQICGYLMLQKLLTDTQGFKLSIGIPKLLL